MTITELERSLLLRRFLDVFDPQQAEILADTLGLIAGQIRGEFATHADILDLKESIRQLAEAQARTEAQVRALAEAQARAEEEFRKYREASEARFARIEATLDRLAEAQARTEAQVRALAEAQARAEEEFRKYREASEARFARIEAALDRLAEAQARTEERVTRLEEAVARLAEAQARTEERVTRLEEAVARLAEAQARTEERVTRLEEAVARLAEAQARTERELQAFRLAVEERFARLEAAQARTERKVDQLAKQVGGLSETVGGDIEDIAYIVIHRVLGREKGWKVGELKRTWHRWNGQQVEVNIFGQAQDPARPDRRIWIVGEAKHNLTMREVEKFARVVRLARQNLEGEIYPVCFCYRARPEVQERIRQLGFHTVFSYGELVESEHSEGSA